MARIFPFLALTTGEEVPCSVKLPAGGLGLGHIWDSAEVLGRLVHINMRLGYIKVHLVILQARAEESLWGFVSVFISHVLMPGSRYCWESASGACLRKARFVMCLQSRLPGLWQKGIQTPQRHTVLAGARADHSSREQKAPYNVSGKQD